MQKYATIAHMTYNDFNSRINLPAWARDQGIKGYEFVRMPRFGWFAVNRDTGDVRSLIDFVGLDDVVIFCTDLILEKHKYHEGRIFYNEVAVARLCNDIRIQLALKRLHQDAVAEYNEGRAQADGKTINLAKMYTDNGMQAFAQTGVGFMSQTIYNTYARQLGIHRSTVNKLIIPTWYTPKHIASFESAQIGNPLQGRMTFYTTGEKGWYGRPEKRIMGDFKQLLTHPGCTWDEKLNLWADGLIHLDDSLNYKQVLEIWSKAKNIRFKQDPLDELERRGAKDQLKDSLSGLSLSQISELEKRFNEKLQPFWQAQKYKLVTIGHLTFVSRDMRYYVESPQGTLEITNFSMEIHSIKKSTDHKFYRVGLIYYEGKQEPFELPNEDFLSVQKLVKSINNFFLERGLGVPIISNAYRGYLLEIINRLNIDMMIDTK
jgi:hypothetical protein